MTITKCELCGDPSTRSKAWAVCEPCTEALLARVNSCRKCGHDSDNHKLLQSDGWGGYLLCYWSDNQGHICDCRSSIK